MKYLCSLVAFMLFFATYSYSQQFEFNHDIGADYAFFHAPEDNNFGGGSPGILYSPRLNFWANNSSSLSFSTNFLLTLQINVQSGAGSSSNVGYGVTGGVNYNFGAASTKDNPSKGGFFIGGGYGFNSQSFAFSNSLFEGEGSSKASGIYANVGGRFNLYAVSLYSILGKNVNSYGLRISRPIGWNK